MFSKTKVLENAVFVLAASILTILPLKASASMDAFTKSTQPVSVRQELYEKYKPTGADWDFFYAIQRGEGELNGHRYTGDLNGKLPNLLRQNLCEVGKWVGLRTTTSDDNIPTLIEPTHFEGSNLSYHFSYTVRNTQLYTGLYEFNITPILSPEEEQHLKGPLKAEKAEENVKSIHLIIDRSEAEEMLQKMKKELAVAEESQSPYGLVKRMAAKVAYEQGLRASIQKIEGALKQCAGSKFVWIANGGARLLGYNNAIEGVLEKEGVLSKRCNHASSLENFSNTAWWIAKYLSPKYGQAGQYFSKAVANILTGSNTLTESFAGAHNGKTNRENLALATSNGVKAVVAFTPGAQAIITLASVTAHYLGDKNSLTELVLSHLHSQNILKETPRVSDQLLDTAAQHLVDNPDVLKTAQGVVAAFVPPLTPPQHP